MRAELEKQVKGLRLPDTSIEEVVANTPDSHLYLNVVGDRCAHSVCRPKPWAMYTCPELTGGCGQGVRCWMRAVRLVQCDVHVLLLARLHRVVTSLGPLQKS